MTAFLTLFKAIDPVLQLEVSRVPGLSARSLLYAWPCPGELVGEVANDLALDVSAFLNLRQYPLTQHGFWQFVYHPAAHQWQLYFQPLAGPVLPYPPQALPDRAWGLNLRHRVTAAEWDRLRRYVYRLADYRCEFCGATQTRLSAHELWDFHPAADSLTGTITLRALVCLCEPCHLLQHYGFASLQAREGRLDLAALQLHACKLNNCTSAAFEQTLLDLDRQWTSTSRYTWTLFLDSLADVLPAALLPATLLPPG